jgi:uncharacterized protein with von Willebrand factor type A (vWA) domain
VLPALLEFGELCRKNGIRVSTSEVLDLVRAIDLVGLADPSVVRAAFAASLVKRAADQDTFDELFDLYFHRRVERARSAAGGAPLAQALAAAGLSEEEIERLLALVADEAARLSPVLRLGLGLRRTELAALLRLSGVKVDLDRLRNPMQIGFFTQRLTDALGFAQAVGELDQLAARLQRTLGAERAALLRRLTEESLARLKGQVREHVRDEFERRNVAFAEQLRSDLLAHKPFGAMSPHELGLLREEVRRLARKLREMASLRPKIERRGRLDAGRTLRASYATFGVPFRLRYRRRRVERPRLVVLCDISDSVRHVSRFMLLFAHTLQDLFSKVRSFVFVSDLGECTDLFRQHELDRAVTLAHAGGVVNVYANSNFGRAFRIFGERYLDAVTPRTTVIVIGDGRNNYNPPEAWALAAIAERARRLLWLTPEPAAAWSFGDSAMGEYEPLCDRVEVVSNLAQLARVVDALVL